MYVRIYEDSFSNLKHFITNIFFPKTSNHKIFL